MPAPNLGLDEVMRLLSAAPANPPNTPLYDQPQGPINEWDMPWRPPMQNNGAYTYSGQMIPGLAGNFPMDRVGPNYMIGRSLHLIPDAITGL